MKYYTLFLDESGNFDIDRYPICSGFFYEGQPNSTCYSNQATEALLLKHWSKIFPRVDKKTVINWVSHVTDLKRYNVDNHTVLNAIPKTIYDILKDFKSKDDICKYFVWKNDGDAHANEGGKYLNLITKGTVHMLRELSLINTEPTTLYLYFGNRGRGKGDTKIIRNDEYGTIIKRNIEAELQSLSEPLLKNSKISVTVINEKDDKRGVIADYISNTFFKNNNPLYKEYRNQLLKLYDYDFFTILKKRRVLNI